MVYQAGREITDAVLSYFKLHGFGTVNSCASGTDLSEQQARSAIATLIDQSEIKNLSRRSRIYVIAEHQSFPGEGPRRWRRGLIVDADLRYKSRMEEREAEDREDRENAKACREGPRNDHTDANKLLKAILSGDGVIY
ncbi:MAG: hypothetical protein J4400_04230 [Candidatus Aenigmarchaeota archaeon]|nr:hypothetical protein [Candidatus Aenigmarchaeota archaeon]